MGRGVHEGAWKETKIACLTSLVSETHEVDPHPAYFADEASVGKLVREIKSIRGEAGERAAGEAFGRDQEARDGESESLLESLVLPPEMAGDSPGEDRSEDAEPATAKAIGKVRAKKKEWRPKRRCGLV